MSSGAPVPTPPPPPGRLVVVSGPSGVGKTAVIDRLLVDPRFGRAVTATTRAPRAGEQDGVDYLFLRREEFLRRVEAGWFLEHAEVYGRLYGTPRVHAQQVVATGRHCLLNIDVQGAASVRAAWPGALLVFLVPPSLPELARRLRDRGLDASDVIADRLAAVDHEMAQADRFDLRIVNRDLEATARKLAAAVGVALS
jgi:guanylate kinase